jgi:hypothetical protein
MSNPRKDEAENKDATVTFRKRDYTVPREYSDWSVDLLESIEEGKSVGIVRGALGPAQWNQIKAMNLKVRDLDELATLIAKALGFGSTGESAPSSD